MSWIKTPKDLKADIARKGFKKTTPKIHIDPCSFRGCRSIDTEKILVSDGEENKLLPLCAIHRKLINTP